MEEDINKNAKFNVGIYIRLSQEDKNKKYESDSESVKNQRILLNNYVKENNFNYIDEYVDDGYTGTDFDRPSFKRMIEDLKKRRIDTVIVKDLSRFGRDHVMTGYYIEIYFPENRIRFISVLENIDTFKIQANNDSATFIQAFNDFYSKQNSIKIRKALDDKRKNGKYIGSLPPFGYKKDPFDKGHLIRNKEVDYIVIKIFKMRFNGIGLTDIATELNKHNYPTPSAYKGTKYSSRLIDNNEWTISSIKKILSNRVYCGDMVQKKQAKVGYKSKKKIALPKDMNIVVENTHEPLIDKETFNYIQQMNKENTRTGKLLTKRKKRILEGLLYCKECNNKLSVSYRKNHNYWSINCNKYSRDPIRKKCYPHFFPYEYLEEQILTEFNKIIKFYINKLNIDELNNDVIKRINNEQVDYNKKIMELLNKKNSIINKLTCLYEEKLDGNISLLLYKEISLKYENIINKINEEIEKTKIILDSLKNKEIVEPDFHKQIIQLLDLKKIKKELVHTLINRIEIDKDRNITIKFKHNIVDDYTFSYITPNNIRNPYGKKGKSNL